MEYFKSCQIDLAEAGLLYLDVFGGQLAKNNSVEVHETDYGFLLPANRRQWCTVIFAKDFMQVYFRVRPPTQASIHRKPTVAPSWRDSV
jgi:hypothetical protein